MKIIFILFFLFFSSNLNAQEIAVIVNETGPLANLSEADIRDIYLGEKRFEGDVRIVPINYSEGPVKDAFFASVLNMTSKEYKIHWTKKVFQEGGVVPQVMNKPQDIIEMVRKIKGAIGYVPKSNLIDVKGIKIIKALGQ